MNGSTLTWTVPIVFVLQILGSLILMRDSIIIRESFLPFIRGEEYHHIMTWCMNKQQLVL